MQSRAVRADDKAPSTPSGSSPEHAAAAEATAAAPRAGADDEQLFEMQIDHDGFYAGPDEQQQPWQQSPLQVWEPDQACHKAIYPGTRLRMG